ncbi:glycosyltransferase family 2 protein [Fulvivirga maritima]|uniref:glycosyltransferase family 2 protein n=1 Tax=Fulvivirga maritima TaxID=2904247 RepID=UPI001F4358D7|nr:glycosyltransferase family 2 protein [Fulvivirga maritima]UII26557.1 glycosyltransferase family 2 protein [Fulvivirga maritima]
MRETAIVILNYNGEHYLRKFLPSVIQYSPGCEIVVADNCSTDESVTYLKENHPEVTVIQLSCNHGYSAGYNEALAQVTAEYYVLLNSDVEVTPNWVTPVIELLKSQDNIVAAQPKILMYDKKTHFEYAGAGGGYIDCLGYPFCRGRLFLDVEEDKGQYDDDINIFWATGACLFIKAKVFHEVGGFDPDFFAHMEEIDLCWRINNAGYEIAYTGKSKVYHVGGGTLHKSNPRKTYLNFRNGLTLIYKNYSRFDLWTKLPIRLALDWIACIKFMLFDSFNDGVAVAKAHFHFIKHLRLNFKKRRAVLKLKTQRSIPTMFRGSVVFEYYIKRKDTFKKLDF